MMVQPSLRRRLSAVLITAVLITGGSMQVIAMSAAESRDEPPTPSAKTSSYDDAVVVGVIGGRELTLGELMFRFANLPSRIRLGYLRTEAPLTRYLHDLAGNLAVVRQAEAMELDTGELFDQLLEIHREEILRDLHARRTVLDDIDEDILRQRYQEQIERFTIEPRVHLRHILVTPVEESPPPHPSHEDAVGSEAAETKIRRLRQEIAGGAVFAEVAARASEGTAARDGGDLGWSSFEELVPEVSAVARELPVGRISSPIRSARGYHLIEVVDRREAGVMPYDQVRELLLQEIVHERSALLRERAAATRRELMEAYDVELFPDRLPW